MNALCTTAVVHNPADRAYIDGHRLMYGDVGEHVAATALLFRDRLMRPGFVLPVIRLAPVSPYGKCLAQAGNSGALGHVRELDQGVWVYLHEKFFSREGRRLDKMDESVLHELLHN